MATKDNNPAQFLVPAPLKERSQTKGWGEGLVPAAASPTAKVQPVERGKQLGVPVTRVRPSSEHPPLFTTIKASDAGFAQLQAKLHPPASAPAS